MIKQIDNILRIPSLVFFLFKSYRIQKQFMKDTIFHDLDDFIKNNDHTLSKNDLYKIRYYYGLAVPVIGEMYKQLENKELTEQERKSLTYLGGTTGLFDDFFDEMNTSISDLKKKLINPSLSEAKSAKEKLFTQFYLTALEHSNSERIKKYYLEVFEAQVQSLKQLDSELEQDEIIRITRQKGGISILLYRSVIESEISEQEKDLIFQIGFLGQLENDIFDIHKDYVAGIKTLATTTKSIASLRLNYITIMKTVFRLIAQLDLPDKNKKKFSRLFSIVACRGLVCLDQFQKLETSKFEISNFTRKQLICDMGTFKNTIKWLGYFINWDRKNLV